MAFHGNIHNMKIYAAILPYSAKAKAFSQEKELKRYILAIRPVGVDRWGYADGMVIRKSELRRKFPELRTGDIPEVKGRIDQDIPVSGLF